MNLDIIPPENYDRRVFLGSSDIASVLGLQPRSWRTALGTWSRKVTEDTEPLPEKEKRKVLARGQVVEPLVAGMLEVLHGITGTVRGHRYADPEVPYFAAEIDMEVPFHAVAHLFKDIISADPGYLDDEIVNVEIKTVHPFAASEWGEEGSDEVPIHYAAQVFWGLGVTRRRFAICAALFGADDLVLYPIVRDDATIDGMRAKGKQFWEDYVLTGLPPPPTTLSDSALLWPQDDGSEVEATEIAAAACVTLGAISASRKSYEDGEELVKLLLREFMKNASVLTHNGIDVATLKAQTTRTIDAAKLKAEFPDAYKACLRLGTTRVLRLKETK